MSDKIVIFLNAHDNGLSLKIHRQPNLMGQPAINTDSQI